MLVGNTLNCISVGFIAMFHEVAGTFSVLYLFIF